MTPLRPTNQKRTRLAKLVVTLLAGVATILWINTAGGDGRDQATSVSTSSLLTIPSQAEPTATPIATTAPLQIPTSTPAPTATPLPTSTAAPTATPLPAPTSTTAPVVVESTSERGDRAPEGSVSVADAGSTAAQEAAAAAPTPVPQPTAAPEPTAVPEPTPTPLPEPTPTVEVVAEPTVQPTAAPTATPTPEPVVGASAAELEVYVLGELNKVRANAGLGPFVLDPAASEIARDWSTQMAAGGFFSHRPSAQLSQMLPSNWREWGENIASAPDIFWAESSLETSPGHYKNMVGPFTHVGVGVYTNGTQVWLTQVFVRYG